METMAAMAQTVRRAMAEATILDLKDFLAMVAASCGQVLRSCGLSSRVR